MGLYRHLGDTFLDGVSKCASTRLDFGFGATNVMLLLYLEIACSLGVSCDILLPFQFGSFWAPWDSGKCSPAAPPVTLFVLVVCARLEVKTWTHYARNCCFCIVFRRISSYLETCVCVCVCVCQTHTTQANNIKINHVQYFSCHTSVGQHSAAKFWWHQPILFLISSYSLPIPFLFSSSSLPMLFLFSLIDRLLAGAGFVWLRCWARKQRTVRQRGRNCHCH